MKNKNKIIIVGLVILGIVLVAFIILSKSNGNAEKVSEDSFPTEVLIPTVDASVKASLEKTTSGKEVILTINNIPKGTTAIEYQLSYKTAEQGLQGVMARISLKEGESDIEKKITLGTCSSGSCVYHEVVGKIQLSLNFSGDYGEKVFNKDY